MSETKKKQAPSPSQDAKQPTCRCGFTRDHHMVTPEHKYSWWGWFWNVAVGVTATPKRIQFRCRVCDTVIEETSDPEILKHYC